MTSFELPEFYMPYAARCNPHRESARVHAKMWATQMGMLSTSRQAHGSAIWDERTFDSADFPLYAALAYPDAPAPELDLLTDWHVWSWFINDFFSANFIHRKDLEGGTEYISKLAAYMPAEITATPDPTNPAEAGLANLWVRTVSTASPDWRNRFFRVLQSYLTNTTWKILNADQDWVPNPINYVIDVRRKAGGMELVACLIEHGLNVEIPAGIASTRPLEVLKDTFSDESDLRNDIFSYQKELRAGELNGVMIMERFLDCDVQRAVDVVNDIITSRMQQFENTALVELPLLFEDYRLDPKTRLDVLRYVKGLADCMAGDLRWHQTTNRYTDTESRDPQHVRQRLGGPTGIGTMVARLGLARRVATVAWPTASPTVNGKGAHRVELPEFYMPFKTRCNSNADLELTHSKIKAWSVEMGLIGSGLADWDEPGFDAGRYVQLTAMCYPDAPSSKLDMVAFWWTWLTFFSDFNDEVFQSRRDLVGEKAAFDRLLQFMPISHTEDVPIPINPAERGLADLWPRISPVMSEDWRRGYAGTIESACEGFLWETLNFIENRIPDSIDYVEMRRKTTGAKMPEFLFYYVLDLDFVPEVHNSRPMRALIEAFCDWWGFVNDIFSYQKEMEREGEVHNSVLIVQRFLDCDVRRAVAIVNDLATSQLKYFEYITDVELPNFVAELGLDAADRDDVDKYVRGVQSFIGGLIPVHVLLASSRYGLGAGSHTTPVADTPAARSVGGLQPGPTGLGTSAARIGSERTASAPASEDPVRARLSFGPVGIGTAAARIGPIRNTDVPEPEVAATQPPDLPDGCVPDVAADPDALSIDEFCEIGVGSVPGS